MFQLCKQEDSDANVRAAQVGWQPEAGHVGIGKLYIHEHPY